MAKTYKAGNEMRKKILSVIRQAQKQIAPLTIDEIASGAKTSKTNAEYHLDKLEEMGIIKRHGSRSIEVVK